MSQSESMSISKVNKVVTSLNYVFIFYKLASITGYTEAHKAAAWGRADSLRALYDCNCDVQSLTTFGERPRDIALRYGYQQCVEFLDLAGESAVDSSMR